MRKLTFHKKKRTRFALLSGVSLKQTLILVSLTVRDLTRVCPNLIGLERAVQPTAEVESLCIFEQCSLLTVSGSQP